LGSFIADVLNALSVPGPNLWWKRCCHPEKKRAPVTIPARAIHSFIDRLFAAAEDSVGPHLQLDILRRSELANRAYQLRCIDVVGVGMG
jgi:hypothetical protein